MLCFCSNMRTGFPFSAVLSAVEELEEQVKGMMQPSALSMLQEETVITYLCFELKVARAKW